MSLTSSFSFSKLRFLFCVMLACTLACLTSTYADAASFMADPAKRQQLARFYAAYKDVAGAARLLRANPTDPALQAQYRDKYNAYANVVGSERQELALLSAYDINTRTGRPLAPEAAVAAAGTAPVFDTELIHTQRLLASAESWDAKVTDLDTHYRRLKDIEGKIAATDDPAERAALESEYATAYDAFSISRTRFSEEYNCKAECLTALGGDGRNYRAVPDSAADFPGLTKSRELAAEADRVASIGERQEELKEEGYADPDSVQAEYEEDGVERMEDMEFSNNSFGKAGERVVQIHNAGRCGGADASAGCEGVAKSLDTMATISQVSDYTAYAAVAGTVAPMVIYAGDQADDQKKVAKIQKVAGVANIAAGIVDVGLGAKGRFSDARKLDRVSAAEQARCAAETEQVNNAIAAYKASYKAYKQGTGPKPPKALPKLSRSCQRFSAKAVSGAASRVKDASNSHMLIGGLKALGGVASLYLAKEAEKRAQNLEDLASAEELAEEEETQTPPTTVGLLGPSGLSNNAVGVVEPTPPTGTSTEDPTSPDSRASILPETGGSIAPRKGQLPNIARRGGGGKPKAGGSGGGGTGGLGSGASTSPFEADTDFGEVGESDSAVAFNGGGGGGYLNAGGTPLGGGDGGFGKMMGSMMSGLLGKGGGNAPKAGVAGASRLPASMNAPRMANASADPNTSIFDRVKNAIVRQVNSGKVVNEVNDINKI